MPSRQSSFRVAIVSLVTCLIPLAAGGAEVLRYVPNEALGFVLVKNLATTDSKFESLAKTIQPGLPAPLAFLQSATGVSDGLDRQGDLLIAVLPSDGPTQDKLRFAVWIPVQDYDRFVTTLGGAPAQQIAEIAIAEEKVLVARHGHWAIVMDPDERRSIQRLVAVQPNPRPALSAWTEWIDANDVTVVALPRGVQAILAWAAASPAAEKAAAEQNGDQIFDFGQFEDPDDPFAAAPAGSSSKGVVTAVRDSIAKWALAAPRLMHIFLRAKLVGGALRLDEAGNLQAGLRVEADERLWAKGGDEQPPPPALYQGGNFVLHGAGGVHQGLAAIAAGAYARMLANDLKNEEHMVLPNATVAQFVQAAERAGAAAQSVVLLTQPGDKEEGVYTNDFLAVRAASAQAFADHVKEVMRLWNSMNRDAETETRLVFDIEDVKLGERMATQYSLDVAAADGAAELPEIRQAMEKFFGPGGKLRLWVAPVDEHTVLLATATPEQVAAALEALDRKQAVDWSRPETADVNRLLPSEADWRLFFSPHDYNKWKRREMDAITGPVIGGPLVEEFPLSPPVGLAGGIRSGELWIDAAVPAETIHSAAIHLKKELE